jgi:hypothetical protein
MAGGYGRLASLDAKGRPPSTRMDSSLKAASRVQMFINADNAHRAYKRSKVKGLVDGVAPYKNQDTTKAGRADMCNVNWRIAEAYLSTALGGFWDIFAETETYAIVQTYHGTDIEASRYSQIITEEFDRLLKKDPNLPYNMKVSQYEMVLYGSGPFFFQDTIDWRDLPIHCGEFYTPEFARSNPEMWEEASARIYYNPSDLYQKIMDEKAARNAGWDVESVKQAIIMAHPRSSQGGQYLNWEWHAQALKNNSYYYSAESETIHCAHYIFKEFPTPGETEGRLTHTIVNLSIRNSNINFMFQHIGRFANWRQVVHPMYYDHGGGGYHHSVVGMGVKMFPAMEYQNRLLCNIADKVFAPKVFFKPTSSENSDKLQLARFGDYAKLPAGTEMIQTPVQSYLQESLMFNREVSQIISSNLSQYRQQLQKTEGNPLTATQVEFMAGEQARLGKTQINHYYDQLDWYYGEKFRRVANLNYPESYPGGKEVADFQKACLRRGVPKAALKKIEAVRANRVIGQGSQFLRQQTLAQLLGIVQMLPELGRERVVKDFIAAQAGYTLVSRYYPGTIEDKQPTDQEAIAVLQVSAIQGSGVPPVVTDSQNHVTFASVFLNAATNALQGAIQASQDPRNEIGPALQLIDVLGVAVKKHLAFFADDPTRKAIYDPLMKQLTQLSAGFTKLAKIYQQQQQQKAQVQQQTNAMQNGSDPEMQLKMLQLQQNGQLKQAELQAKMGLKTVEKQHNMDLKQRQTQQKLATTDVLTASKITNEQKKTEATIQAKKEVQAKSE